MKILVLWSKGAKGKTTTLNLLTNLLSDNFIKIDAQKHSAGSKIKDNCYILTYKGKKIGITTRGDSKDALADDFAWLKDNSGVKNLDLYICASRSKGSSVLFIEETAADGEIYWISKTTISFEKKRSYSSPRFIEDQREIANEKQAESLADFIDAIIANGVI